MSEAEMIKPALGQKKRVAHVAKFEVRLGLNNNTYLVKDP